MASGDLSADQVHVLAVCGRPGGAAELADDLQRAKNAIRVRDVLSPGDLQFCIAFRLDAFAYLAAMLEEQATGDIAAERQARIDRAAFDEKYRQDQQTWGLAEMERLRSL